MWRPPGARTAGGFPEEVDSLELSQAVGACVGGAGAAVEEPLSCLSDR